FRKNKAVLFLIIILDFLQPSNSTSCKLNTLCIIAEVKQPFLPNIRSITHLESNSHYSYFFNSVTFLEIYSCTSGVFLLFSSLFKPYKLYEHLFHSPREELVISNKYVIELAPPAVTPFPPLLEEGMPLESCESLIVLPIFAEMEPKGSDQEGHLEEPCPEAESLEAGAVAAFTVEDQKSAVDGIPNEIIGNLEAEINEKLQIQEEAYTLRTEKIKSPK
uniref:Uncharacterized protein n=1 Tax=Anas platyrhynchos platyrhynchos TaxID=8840 RepID=A0A493T057_ANAPP